MEKMFDRSSRETVNMELVKDIVMENREKRKLRDENTRAKKKAKKNKGSAVKYLVGDPNVIHLFGKQFFLFGSRYVS